MKQDLQLAAHLDADTLAAFAERALPPHGREAALAHLAICPDCREILQFAVPPFEDTQPALPLPGRARFAGWRWVWAGAAACAGAGLASLQLLRPPAPAPIPAPMAKVVAPPSFPSAAAGSAPVLKPKTFAARALRPAPPETRQAHRVSPAAQPVAPLPELETGNPVSGRQVENLTTEQRTVKAKSLAVVPRAAAVEQPQAAAIAHPAAEPAPTNPQRAAESASAQTTLQNQAVATQPLASAEANSSLASIPRPAAGAAQLLPELPSGLNTGSRYAQGKRVVAVDTAGTLFFSKDVGRHWTAAKPVWGGRVERVEAAAAPVPPPPTPAATVKARNSTAMFALFTTAGERWVSTDGKHWTHEDP